ncbi:MULTISPECIES: peptidylprolyl isomerase [Dyadobacter]|uniref:Periplasmic chaperone PpiD n=1 Tax=Dyadobacter chenhuakuii TaxID=2909339 RepID=A0A9X1TT42_9BACT|nr:MULTISPECIES: SurA N-terminal domain-containing protein [Dyadobacter]MCE7069604.1 SurA N-terminal domain-containing protein [Dyadobacter sp. CY327]MCF2491929.1 SurA N-terminal domain-containing protein [Dyadobacter chenhuakuii]MCF2498715.1 SurA N-terminal domain-containing protein [Dyadobacter chenhuakuii]USJ28909.1 SurA N-terminal domain-containing protein [Dyadobacter chenhuakuii]
MALITKIREKSGIAVTVIAISLILFMVGGDLMGPNSMLGGGNDQTVGEIAGKEINIKDFQSRVDGFRQNYEAQSGRSLNENELASLRDQAWNQFVVDIAYKKEFEDLGLTVTDQELVEMVQGNHISPSILQAFSDPTTGKFDKNAVVNYLKNLKTLPVEQQKSWENFEKSLREERTRAKYENMLRLSTYIPKALAEKEYVAQNSKATLRYLYVPYFSVVDTTIKVTDKQLEDYLSAHRSEYKGTDTRSIEYVTFPIQPAKDDSAALYSEIKELARGLATAQNDSSFAAMNSDIPLPINMSLGTMSDQLKEAVKTFVPGGVYGPYREGNTYYIYKYGGTRVDTVASARASHILIRAENQSDSAKAAARTKAEGILAQIRAGANFEALAATTSADPQSAQRGGDLSYFQNNGQMVKPFEEAVFSATAPGLIPRLVESQFGFHIIKVTDPKSNTLYRIAAIGKTIAPSQATRDEAYRKADEFANTVKTKTDFDEAVKKNKALVVANANRIPESATNINAIQNGRDIVRWAFKDDSDINEVSPVFETEEQYIVAVLVGKSDAKDVKVADFRDELTTKVRNQIKAEQITAKLKGATGDLPAIAAKYGAGALVENATDISLATGFLTSAGFDPIALGKAFGLKPGQKSDVFTGENGVFIMELVSKTEAPKVADYTQYKTQLTQSLESRMSYLVNEAIRENAKIEDRRAKFF